MVILIWLYAKQGPVFHTICSRKNFGHDYLFLFSTLLNLLKVLETWMSFYCYHSNLDIKAVFKKKNDIFILDKESTCEWEEGQMKTKESLSRLPPSLELNGGLDPNTPRQGPSPDQIWVLNWLSCSGTPQDSLTNPNLIFHWARLLLPHHTSICLSIQMEVSYLVKNNDTLFFFILIFLKILFLSNIRTQHGALAHNLMI